jgi:serine protease Do
MMTWKIFTVAALVVAVHAQEVPLQRAEELQETRRQAQEVYDVLQPLAQQASPSTVWVWVGRRQVSLGTVIGEGDRILTKWSEVAFAQSPIQVVGGDGKTATATVLGVYQDDDLALLQLEDASFPPVRWNSDETTVLGQFLVAASPDAMPASVGVVAVAERSLRDSDQAFIGITLDPSYEGEGIRVLETAPRGGAANAGMGKGDVVLRIEGEAVSSPFELRNALLDFSPGDEVTLDLLRDGKEVPLIVELTSRPEFPGVPEGRLRGMRQMGGAISLVGGGFPMAIQTDMKLTPNRCGGPVLDLDGHVVGMSIARTDRTRSFVIPSSRIEELLEADPTDPTDPALAQVPERGMPRQAGVKPIPMDAQAAGRLQRHLEEMSSFLRRFDREMDGIGR